MGKIRWRRGALEYWSLERVSNTNRYKFRLIFVRELKGICGIFCLHVCIPEGRLPNRRHKEKKGEELSQRFAVYTFSFFMGAFQTPRDEKSVSYLSLCFKGG